MDAMRNEPLARRAMVARLRVRRRAVPRMARPERVRWRLADVVEGDGWSDW
jgi:hypothetical protein